MLINFGKYEGKTSEVVILKYASYVTWVLSQTNANQQLAVLRAEINRQIQILDTKSFIGKCSKAGCTHPVIKLTSYVNNYKDLYAWCSFCNPYSSGANVGKLTEVRTYADVMRHVEYQCGGTKVGYDTIAKSYAKMKGLPKRVSSSAAIHFFT